MTFNEYQQLVNRTWNQDPVWREQVMNAALGLGEIGEVQNLIKKAFFHGHELNAIEVARELGDALYYASKLVDLLGFTLEQVAIDNIDKLSTRYPEGFSTERSMNRKEFGNG